MIVLSFDQFHFLAYLAVTLRTSYSLSSYRFVSELRGPDSNPTGVLYCVIEQSAFTP